MIKKRKEYAAQELLFLASILKLSSCAYQLVRLIIVLLPLIVVNCLIGSWIIYSLI